MEGILFPKGVIEGREGLKEYQARGGYEALANALKGTPEDIIQIVSDAGLRGQGGRMAGALQGRISFWRQDLRMLCGIALSRLP